MNEWILESAAGRLEIDRDHSRWRKTAQDLGQQAWVWGLTQQSVRSPLSSVSAACHVHGLAMTATVLLIVKVKEHKRSKAQAQFLWPEMVGCGPYTQVLKSFPILLVTLYTKLLSINQRLVSIPTPHSFSVSLSKHLDFSSSETELTVSIMLSLEAWESNATHFCFETWQLLQAGKWKGRVCRQEPSLWTQLLTLKAVFHLLSVVWVVQPLSFFLNVSYLVWILVANVFMSALSSEIVIT